MKHGNGTGDGTPRGRFIMTDAEVSRFADAVRAGILDALDARDDTAPDVDALGDARRVGERISDGFALLNGAE